MFNFNLEEILKSKPDFISEEGIHWWKHSDLTNYSKSKGLKDIHGWLVRHANGEKFWVLTQDGEVIDETQQYEGSICKIDLLKMIEDGMDQYDE